MTRKALNWFFTGSTYKDMFFVLVVLVACIALVILPTGFEERIGKVDEHVQGEIISVDNSAVMQFGLVRSGTQVLDIRIIEGSQKGSVVEAVNNFTGKMELDKYFEVGDRALVDLTIDGGKVTFANAADHYRIDVEMVLLGLFALLLLFFGGFTGFKALLSFVFTALALWKILIPFFLKGIDPILVSFSVVTLLTSVIIFLVGGINRKGFVAFLGAMLGLGLTCILSMVFSGPFHLHGAVKPFSETLLYSGFAHLNLTKIFLASIFLASSGAVMDLSMDIASALHEIVEHHPKITTFKLLRSGMVVGRMVIGTMTTTLLLAYSASYITMLMVFMGQGIPMVNILNLNYVAAEMLHTLVGSFGLVTVAPFTAVIGAVLYTRSR